MDWKDEEVKDVYEVAQKLGRFMDFESLRAIMTRAVELAAARGGTMTAGMLRHRPHNVTIGEWVAMVREHISALGARNAVLEAESVKMRQQLGVAHMQATDFQKGAEAMRAACWEAVLGQIQVFAMAGGLFEAAIKKAIEGAVP